MSHQPLGSAARDVSLRESERDRNDVQSMGPNYIHKKGTLAMSVSSVDAEQCQRESPLVNPSLEVSRVADTVLVDSDEDYERAQLVSNVAEQNLPLVSIQVCMLAKGRLQQDKKKLQNGEPLFPNGLNLLHNQGLQVIQPNQVNNNVDALCKVITSDLSNADSDSNDPTENISNEETREHGDRSAIPKRLGPIERPVEDCSLVRASGCQFGNEKEDNREVTHSNLSLCHSLSDSGILNCNRLFWDKMKDTEARNL